MFAFGSTPEEKATSRIVGNFALRSLTLENGAETQFTLDEYSQPRARPPAATQTVEKQLESSYTSKDTEKDPDAETRDEEIAQEEEEEEGEAGDWLETELYHSPDLKVVLQPTPGIAGGNTTHEFLVSSHVLSIASVVWKRIITPAQGAIAFKALATEIRNGSVIMIMELQGDDPDALLTIFQIIHLQTEDVPRSISFDLLRKVAVVSDKYDCGKALKPWTSMWLRKHESKATLAGFEDWLFIAKALDKDIMKVKEISRELAAKASSLSICGSYFLRHDNTSAKDWEVKVELIPENVLKYIKSERAEAVRRIINNLRNFVRDISSASYQSSGFNRFVRPCIDNNCLDIALGSLIRSLKTLKLWPLVTPGDHKEWHGSVSLLVARVDNIKMTTLIPKRLPSIEKREVLSAVPAPTRPIARNLFSQPVNTPPRSSSPSLFTSLSPTQNAKETNVTITRGGERGLFAAPNPASSSILDSSPASTIESLRFEQPAFDQGCYLEQYTPCHAAFRLGTLIKDCKRILEKINEGGYED